MSRERKTSSTKKAPSLREYEIAGNHIRAYFDATDKLVFVVDETIDAVKPNVLLVVNPDGARKWDDILSNDYGVDLETIRPRRDNKYQKLDIEYAGLDVYDALIRAYTSGDGLDSAVSALGVYRDAAARDAAQMRLTAAENTVERARETIERANTTITELNAHIRELRAQLTQQRRNVGREPTKRSASKILRTESQIDAASEKLARARRRLAMAKRRMAAAAADSDVAREILARKPAVADMRDKNVAIADMRADEPPANIAMPQNTGVAKRKSAPVPAAMPDDSDDTSDEKVKPLFDRDPNIMDSDIAFKPIDFDIPTPAAKQETPAPDTTVTDDAPAEFVVPLSFADDADNDTHTTESTDDAPADLPAAPVLNSMRPVVMDDVPNDDSDDETPTPILPTPVVSNDKTDMEYSRDDDMETDVASIADTDSEMPEISVATNASGFRPVSPITGGAPVGASTRRPTLVYYVMLFVLIVLSIFTLWLYQRNGKNTTPNLVATSNSVPTVATTPTDNADKDLDSAFIIMGDADAEFMPAPAIDDVVPSPQPVVDETPVASAPVVAEPEPVATEPAAIDDESDFDTAPQPATETESESVDFVADDDTAASTIDKPEYSVASTAAVVENDGQMCDDGSMPDANGCCGDEEFSQLDDGTPVCCVGDDCFPPM